MPENGRVTKFTAQPSQPDRAHAPQMQQDAITARAACVRTLAATCAAYIAFVEVVRILRMNAPSFQAFQNDERTVPKLSFHL